LKSKKIKGFTNHGVGANNVDKQIAPYIVPFKPKQIKKAGVGGTNAKQVATNGDETPIQAAKEAGPLFTEVSKAMTINKINMFFFCMLNDYLNFFFPRRVHL
jgi:hypothetical protein